MIHLNPSSPPQTLTHRNVLESIGWTPLVQLERYLDRSDVNLIVKLESSNPGGSAKDRPARQMIEHGLIEGLIDERTTIVESSSGNMGIGLAQACRYYDLEFICVVDPHAQNQNLSIMKALGAKIEMVSTPKNGSLLAARLVRVEQLLGEIEHAYWPNQYANLQNPLAHQVGTIREIDAALNGEFDYLFVATSSTGTACGCRDYLHTNGRVTRVVAVDAVGSRLFGGRPGERKIPGLGAGKVSDLAQGQVFDEVQRVRDIDCVVGCRRLAEQEAILAGGSAGGVLETVRKMQDRLVGKTCVAILHDSGTRYLDTVFSDDWVNAELGVDSNRLRQLVESPACGTMNDSIAQSPGGNG